MRLPFLPFHFVRSASCSVTKACRFLICTFSGCADVASAGAAAAAAAAVGSALLVVATGGAGAADVEATGRSTMYSWRGPRSEKM